MNSIQLKHCSGVLVLFFCALILGCGSSSNIAAVNSESSSSPQLLNASSWSNSGGVDQSLTAPRNELASQSCLTCLGMPQPPSCTLHAGNAPMAFFAQPSASWFDVSPILGTIAPNGSATITISAIYASLLPAGNNKGSVIVTAPGYADNTKLSVTLACGIYNSGVQSPPVVPPDNSMDACHLSVVCPPCSTNTAGNTAYTIASVTRTAGASLYQLSTSPNLPANTQVVISGLADNSFNGTFLISSIPEADQFVVTQQSLPDATSGPGTAYIPETVSCPW